MSQTQPTRQPDQTRQPVTVSRDLAEIIDLHAALHAQAIARASASDIPGGAAMYALGHVANLEAWEHLNASGETLGRSYTSPEDEDPDELWGPLQTLEFWSEDWRRELGAETDLRPTVASEARFLRGALDWAWGNELHWDDFAADVNRARRKLENILHAGDRAERTQVICHMCEGGHRLIRQYGTAPDGAEDRWKCPGCKHRHDADSVSRAYARMLRSRSAERWVSLADAIGTLKEQGRPERTIRAWLASGEGGAFCDPVTHEVWCWWPDLWRRHLTTPTRCRERSA